jgi:hypothetical protein
MLPDVGLTLVIPALRRLGQEDGELEASLDHIVRLSQKKKKTSTGM